MITRLGISSDRIALFPGQSPVNLWAVSPKQLRSTLEALADDMSAAAIEAGDHALPGAERAFAAQRAITAEELHESAVRGMDPYYRDQEADVDVDVDSEVEVMELEENE